LYDKVQRLGKKLSTIVKGSSPGSSNDREGLCARIEALEDGRERGSSGLCFRGDQVFSVVPLLIGEDIHLVAKLRDNFLGCFSSLSPLYQRIDRRENLHKKMWTNLWTT
jgi:hypothetical protein